MSTYNADKLPGFAVLKPASVETFPRFTPKQHYKLLEYTLARDAKTGRATIEDDKGWKTEVTTEHFHFLFCTLEGNELWIPVAAATRYSPVPDGSTVLYRWNTISRITTSPELLAWDTPPGALPITHYYPLS